AAIDAGAGIVFLAPLQFGTNIDLGGPDALNTLGLTQAELNTVTAGILRVGALFATNNLTVTAAITAPATWNTLSLSGVIAQNSGAPLTVANLQAASTGSVSLTDAGNAVTTLAGGSAGTITRGDSTSL